jgi:hypothetical protein
MVSMLDSSAVDHGFEPRSGQTKDNKIGICCFSAKHCQEKLQCEQNLFCCYIIHFVLYDNSAIFPSYHGENKLIFNEMVMMSACTRTTRLAGLKKKSVHIIHVN